MDSVFWNSPIWNFISIILGAMIGIPIAFFVERKLEEIRDKKRKVKNEEKIEALLIRTMVQISNIESTIRVLEFATDKDFNFLSSFPEVEVIQQLYSMLAELEANWEVLLSLDIIVCDTKMINSLFGTYRDIFSVLIVNKDFISGKYLKEINYEIELASSNSLDAISDFRILVEKNYPSLLKKSSFEQN